MATIAAARSIFCKLHQVQNTSRRETDVVPKLRTTDIMISSSSSSSSSSAAGAGAGAEGGTNKIVLQPRVCTLRSYGSDGDGLMRTRSDADVSRFLASLSDYIDNSKKSQDFEIISGRLAMIAFAGAITVEVVTGNSLFRKMELQGIAEAAGVCLGAIICAAAFAWFSSARTRVGRIFTLSCNTFVDSLIDKLVDGLFYEGELSDWSDEM